MESETQDKTLNRHSRFYRNPFIFPLLLAMLALAAFLAWSNESEFDKSKSLTEAHIERAALERAEKSRLAQLQSAIKNDGPNGFDVTRLAFPLDELLSGGPGRDGIPSIDNPKFVDPAKVDYLKDDDLVVGIVRDNDARAYPLRILVSHEIVNDTVGGDPLAITYCPLCGTAMVFRREVAGQELTFGVSGLLYQSDVLLFDRQTESLWSQLKQEAVSGPMIKKKLEWISVEHMTWAAWKAMFPQGKVLSLDTGFYRNYAKEAYAGYKQSPKTYYPFRDTRKELSSKQWVVGVIVLGVPKAYSVEALETLGDETIEDNVGGVKIRVQYDREKKRARFFTAKTGDPIPHVNVYWFAWQAFYPGTLLYQPASQQ